MKSLRLVNFSDIVDQLGDYSTIIDVRSEKEFADDHLPGAINFPVLDNAQRILVGTLYKQASPFEAKKLGAALVARNVADHIERHFIHEEKSWRPLIYCWRGGNRSGAMAHILAKIGWHVDQLDGGYKAYRRQVIDDLDAWPAQIDFRVICGTTGSGKSRLLRTLAQHGAQVLDLEQLAEHRGSVLGLAPGACQPSQKMFESRLWSALRRFDRSRPVFVESESKKVGGVHIPDRLMQTIRDGACIELCTTQATRLDLLLDEYSYFTGDARASLLEQLAHLSALHGNQVIARWHALIEAGDFRTLVTQLLDDHYDPSYTRSMQRNFVRFATRQPLSITAYDDAQFVSAAQRLLTD